MRKNDLAALKSLPLICALLAPALGQTPAPPPPAPPQDDDGGVVRITSNLVQFDAVVYDKDDRQVTDLRPEEFEVTVGGKRQEITNFSYVSTVSGRAVASPAPPAAGGPAPPPVPPARLRPEQVRRTVALVVDDLGASFESLHSVRRALRKFVDEQMQPGDLVAVIRTSAGIGSLQQFTNDKRILHKAIDRVRWYASGRSGVSAFAAIEADPQAQIRAGERAVGIDTGADDTGAGADDERNDLFTVGTLGALNFIVRGMDELPGRKSIVVFSDGLIIFRRGRGAPEATRALEQLRRLTDLATRSAVTVYTVDARGLPTLGLTAADSTAGRSAAQVEERLSARRNEYFDAQEGLHYMAAATGGAFFRGSNDLTRGIRRALDEQQGYYLIGFRPDAEVFTPERGRARYNRFQVKLTRPGLKVRTRGGFYGVTDQTARPARGTRAQQLLAAVTSPFASGDLGLRLTTLFSRGEKDASVLDSVLHMDVSRFTVVDDEGDWKRLVLDVVALTFGEEGQLIDSRNRTETVRMRGDALRYVMEHGLVYRMEVPLKKPGAYQLRVAVRDSATERVGSASQYVEVPDLKNKRLALSSIALTKSPPETAAAAGGAAQPAAAAEEYNPLRDVAVRRFRQGDRVDFIYHIYNAKADRAAGRPQLQTQMRLFRDGRKVYEGRAQAYDASRQTDPARLQAGSRLLLGQDLPPGEYVLQVAVTDALADRKHAVATQWIDFEIVK